MESLHAPEIIIPSVQVPRPLCRRAPVFKVFEFRHDRGRDAVGDFVLNVEDVCQLTIKAFGPDMVARLRVDQLSCDPQALPRLAYASFKDVSGPQLFSNLFDAQLLALKREGGVAGDDWEGAPMGEGGDDIFGRSCFQRGEPQ